MLSINFIALSCFILIRLKDIPENLIMLIIWISACIHLLLTEASEFTLIYQFNCPAIYKQKDICEGNRLVQALL